MKIRLKTKRRTPDAAPVVTQDPTITSAEPGVYKVGVLLSSTPPVYTPATARSAPQWVYNGGASEIEGAVGSSYLPTADLEGETLQCRWTLDAFLASTTALTSAVGPVLALGGGVDPEEPPDPSLAYFGVHEDTLARRATVVAHYTDVWPGCPAEPTFGVDTLVTSRTAMVNAFNALPTDDLSAWHRIRLDSSQPHTVWEGSSDLYRARTVNQAITPGGVWDEGHYYGSWADRSSAGGGVLIESSDPENPVVLYSATGATDVLDVRGVRGLQFRYINWSNRSPLPTEASRKATFCLKLTRNDTYRDAPVVRVDHCGFGLEYYPDWDGDTLYAPTAIITGGAVEQLDIMDNVVRVAQSGWKTTGVRLQRVWRNDIQGILADCEQHFHTSAMAEANDAWDEKVVFWGRLNTYRNLSDTQELSLIHTDMRQFGTSTDISGSYLILEEFETGYLERTFGADSARIDPNSVFVDGEYVTIDDQTYTARNTPVLATDFSTTGNLTTQLASLLAVVRATPPTGMINSLAAGGLYLEIAKVFGDIAVVSSNKAGLVVSDYRIASGTQGQFRAISHYPIDTVSICNMVAVGASNAQLMHNGDCVIDRCTYARVGNIALNATVEDDGFDHDLDVLEPNIGSSMYPGNVATHLVRNSVMAKVNDDVTAYREDGVYSGEPNQTLTTISNIFTAWRVGALEGRVEELMDGDFYFDVQGRVRYTLADGADVTPQQFRENMYAQLRLADPVTRATDGCTDPANWPLE